MAHRYPHVGDKRRVELGKIVAGDSIDGHVNEITLKVGGKGSSGHAILERLEW